MESIRLGLFTHINRFEHSLTLAEILEQGGGDRRGRGGGRRKRREGEEEEQGA